MVQQRIGLIGGLSWFSTADYYQRINQLVHQRLGAHHSAECVVLSLDEQAFLDAIQDDPNSDQAAQMLCEAVTDLQKIGCSVIAMTANGAHRFIEQIQSGTGVRLVSIMDAVAQDLLRQEVRRVGLLGVANTMRQDFYKARLAEWGVQTLVPSEAKMDRLHALIMDELTLGIFRESTRDEILDCVNALQAQGAQRVILGCTELPLLFTEAQMAQYGLVSSLELHCQRIVAQALALE